MNHGLPLCLFISYFDEPAMLSDMIGAYSSVPFMLVAMSTGKFIYLTGPIKLAIDIFCQHRDWKVYGAVHYLDRHATLFLTTQIMTE